jgi:hypothetical protein
VEGRRRKGADKGGQQAAKKEAVRSKEESGVKKNKA